MALRPIHIVADRWFAQLNASVLSGATSWVLQASGADGLPVPTAREAVIVHCDAEKVLVTDIDVDTPSAGLDTLTVVRGYGGTTPASHAADAYVGHFYYEEHHNTVSRENARLRAFLRAWIGRDGVVQDGGLQVVATGTPDLNVNITAGFALVAGDVVELEAAAAIAVAAPVGNPRIDTVQLTQAGEAEIKTGTPAGSPTAPAVDADALLLATVYCRVGMTSVKDTDDATNGYITIADNYL
jgi:hypothetical protein